MSNINHKASDFDAAIRKVRADYADVSNVNAVAGDVAEGKKFMNSSGTLITGNLSSARIAPDANVSGDEISLNETDYPITIVPRVNVNQAGIIENTVIGTAVTKYIKTEEKSVTPTTRDVTVTPSYGKLMSKIIVAAADVPPVINKMYVSRMSLPAPTSYTGTSRKTYAYNGNTHNNVYCSSTAAQSGVAKVYLYKLSATLSSTNYIDIIDTNTKQIPSTTIVLSAGESITSTGNTFAPAGVLTFTTEGRLQFKHTAAFYTSIGSVVFLLWINGCYYVPCVDYKLFSHGYSGVGSFSTSSATYINGGYFMSRNPGSTTVTYYRPKTLFGNLTNVYFNSYYNSSSSYELLRMTFNYGTYESFFIEDTSN